MKITDGSPLAEV